MCVCVLQPIGSMHMGGNSMPMGNRPMGPPGSMGGPMGMSGPGPMRHNNMGPSTTGGMPPMHMGGSGPTSYGMNTTSSPSSMSNTITKAGVKSTTTLNKPIAFSKRVESSGPAVTVFVGNITERAPDVMIRQILNTCGPVLSWKRVQGASGKLQG